MIDKLPKIHNATIDVRLQRMATAILTPKQIKKP